jgi:hypothetical protein
VTETYLRDVLDLPEAVHAGDFKVELTSGFTDAGTEARVREYVVTDQLRTAFRKALGVVQKATRDGGSYAAYLHGSFGSGKSHFLTVLHAVLNGHVAARQKPGLQPVIAENDAWLRGKRFLMVPYHLVGATDLDAAILGGYVAHLRLVEPDASAPAVYRSDAMLADARRQREFLGDDARFAAWLGDAAVDPGDLDVIDGGPPDGWHTADLDAAFAAPPGSPHRRALESALLSGPMSSYARGATGDAEAFVPLEDGLAVIAEHARSLGYDGLVLFLDELILWLQAHLSNQEFVNTQVSKLVKLIESGVAERALPIAAFISRQRDLSKLVGEDVTGADVKNLEAQVEYLSERFDIINLEDSNLPAIVRERVLRPRTGQEAVLDAAFASIESSRPGDREVLLDATGATEATWEDFRRIYPLSPALLNVLVALSGALQRERTGLKLLQEMLHRRRDDMTVGQLIPLGDLWDVLASGTGAAFTDRLRRESEAAHRFYARARAHLVERYGEGSRDFVAVDRFVKTLLLASLAPQLPALTRLTGARIAALNLGSLQSRTVEPARLVVKRLQDLQADFGELRSDGEQDPVFSLHLSDLDVEPLLDMVGERDAIGARRIWLKDQLWDLLGVRDTGEFVSRRDIVWLGTRRTAEFVFANVRDRGEVPDLQFGPEEPGAVRLVLDYPFDIDDHSPAEDVARVERMRREGIAQPCVVWLPHHFTAQRSAQLGRLLKINYLLERERLDDYAADRSADVRLRIRGQLQVMRENLSSQLRSTLAQAYGVASADAASVRADLDGDQLVQSLLPGLAPRLAGGATFEHNAQVLVERLYATLHPRHPDLDPQRSGRAVTVADLRTTLGWITKAMENGDRRAVVDAKALPLVRRVVHGLALGEVGDGPLHVDVEWRRRIDQQAAAHGATGDLGVEDIRRWIAELGPTGLPRPVSGLIICTYALLADRAWVHHGSVESAPDLDKIGPGWALRAQELPSETEFATARARVAALFGIPVPDTYFARTVHQLAERTRMVVAEKAIAVDGVWQALVRHGTALGLDGATARTTTAERAAALLARLTAARDDLALVRALAAPGQDGDPTDAVLGAAISSAPAVLTALDGVEWPLLESVRGLEGHEIVGERAQRLRARVADAAAADELERELAPALAAVRPEATALAAEVARLAGVGSGAVANLGGLSATARATVSRTVSVAGLDDALAEVRHFVERHPGERVELTMRVVDGQGLT